jgi:cbb3-type cytochrome oxidase subunit 3
MVSYYRQSKGNKQFFLVLLFLVLQGGFGIASRRHNRGRENAEAQKMGGLIVYLYTRLVLIYGE